MKLTIIKKNPHPDDHTIRTTDTPGFKPFTIKKKLSRILPKIFKRLLFLAITYYIMICITTGYLK